MKAERGLYFHLPFCQSKCPYCDFHSAGADEELMNRYRDALLDEIQTGRRNFAFTGGEKKCFSTVYFGGGTPSYFGAERLIAVLEKVAAVYSLSSDAEITVEVNPASASLSLFQKLFSAGVNRLSLGLQSAVDKERRALGRISKTEAVKKAVKDARQAGFENISLDLMLGIPCQTEGSLCQSLEFCRSLPVTHISAYLLKLEENTPFFQKQHELSLPGEEEAANFYLLASQELEKFGFSQYEISNFAKKGFASRHNLNYWLGGEYLGIGASAHSYWNGKRFFQPPDTEGFLRGRTAEFEGEGGGEEEYIMLRLRLTEGLSYEEFEKKFHHPFPQKSRSVAENPLYADFIRQTPNGFALTKKGFLLSNTVIAKILYP